MAVSVNPSVVVLFSFIHMDVIKPETPTMGQIPRIILIARAFDKRFGKMSWNDKDNPIETTARAFYNFHFNNPNFK